MTVNRDLHALLEIVACPSCHGRLSGDGPQLKCESCLREYGAQDGVPVLRVDPALVSQPSLAARGQYAILGSPRVYDLQQRYGGGRKIADRVEEVVGKLDGGLLLDIGAGTGMAAPLLQSSTGYVWMDNDALKLRGLLSKQVECLAVMGSVVELPFRDGSFDWTLMVDVSHHLDDDVLDRAIAEVARVTRRQFVFSDAVRGTRRRSNLLWHLDLGRYPRTEKRLLEALDVSFEVTSITRFRINHDHIICVCVPRTAGTRPSS